MANGWISRPVSGRKLPSGTIMTGTSVPHVTSPR
jgi:hypothetical protein